MRDFINMCAEISFHLKNFVSHYVEVLEQIPEIDKVV